MVFPSNVVLNRFFVDFLGFTIVMKHCVWDTHFFWNQRLRNSRPCCIVFGQNLANSVKSSFKQILRRFFGCAVYEINVILEPKTAQLEALLYSFWTKFGNFIQSAGVGIHHHTETGGGAFGPNCLEGYTRILLRFFGFLPASWCTIFELHFFSGTKNRATWGLAV